MTCWSRCDQAGDQGDRRSDHQGGNSTHLPARALDMIRKLLKVPNFHIVRADPHENSALLPLLAMPENGDTIAGERLVDLDAVAPSPRS
jgi:hypothetical protein